MLHDLPVEVMLHGLPVKVMLHDLPVEVMLHDLPIEVMLQVENVSLSGRYNDNRYHYRGINSSPH